MNIAVVTDSNSGISEREAKEWGIYILPMPIIIEDDIYFEGKNITKELFYNSLISGKNVSTSQPSPGNVVNLWESILNDGYDEIVYIPMSSGLSSSCHTALSLALEYKGRVEVVDNHRISVTQKHSVMEAVSLSRNNYSAFDIKRILEKNAYESSIYIAVDTLEYLKKGGRVTPAGAAVGSVLNIKPVLTIQGGKLDAFSVTRGMNKCKKKMIEAIKDDINLRFGDPSTLRIKIGAAGSFLDDEMAVKWKNEVSAAFDNIQVTYDPLAFSIGCHVGPNAIGIGVSKVVCNI
ncbi:DegV family protein [Clostridium sp. MT-14]|uniref:DegV family protein n=1 Tax=Clostridium aromativorans TaxID=2836848 RepID=A0ABS8N9X9_9CLOT|nr:DegV family protein [Clostridium aromativorans]MCC9296606.1 DegV family protein [Clostridium aromativorans]CAB1246919.1 DegV family protein [Clostridiaceae bacterium BL-3]